MISSFTITEDNSILISIFTGFNKFIRSYINLNINYLSPTTLKFKNLNVENQYMTWRKSHLENRSLYVVLFLLCMLNLVYFQILNGLYIGNNGIFYLLIIINVIGSIFWLCILIYLYFPNFPGYFISDEFFNSSGIINFINLYSVLLSVIGNIFLIFAIFQNNSSSVYSLPYVIFVLLTLTSFKLTFFLALRIVLFMIISLIFIYIWILSSNFITLTIFITDLISYLTISLAGLLGAYFAEITARSNFWSLFVSFRKQLALTACVDLLYSVRNRKKNKGDQSFKIPVSPLSTPLIINELNSNKHILNIIEHKPSSANHSPLKGLIYSSSNRTRSVSDPTQIIDVPTLNSPTDLGAKNALILDLSTPQNKYPQNSPQKNVLINSYSRRITGNNPLLSPNQRNLANMLSVPATPSNKTTHNRRVTAEILNFNSSLYAFLNSENTTANEIENKQIKAVTAPSSAYNQGSNNTDNLKIGTKKFFFFNDSIADFHINKSSSEAKPIINSLVIEDSPAPSFNSPIEKSNTFINQEPRTSLSNIPMLSYGSPNMCISVTSDRKKEFEVRTPLVELVSNEVKKSPTNSKNSEKGSLTSNKSFSGVSVRHVKSEHRRAKSASNFKRSEMPGFIASLHNSDIDKDSSSTRSSKKYLSGSNKRKPISFVNTVVKAPTKTELLRSKILSVVKQIKFRKRLEMYEHTLFEIIDYKLQFLDPDLEDGFSLIHLEQNTSRILALMSLFIFSLLLGAILDWKIAPADVFWPSFVWLRFGLMIPSLLVSLIATYILKTRYILHQVILGGSILATSIAYSIQVYMLPEYNQLLLGSILRLQFILMTTFQIQFFLASIIQLLLCIAFILTTFLMNDINSYLSISNIVYVLLMGFISSFILWTIELEWRLKYYINPDNYIISCDTASETSIF